MDKIIAKAMQTAEDTEKQAKEMRKQLEELLVTTRSPVQVGDMVRVFHPEGDVVSRGEVTKIDVVSLHPEEPRPYQFRYWIREYLKDFSRPNLHYMFSRTFTDMWRTGWRIEKVEVEKAKVEEG